MIADIFWKRIVEIPMESTNNYQNLSQRDSKRMIIDFFGMWYDVLQIWSSDNFPGIKESKKVTAIKREKRRDARRFPRCSQMIGARVEGE